MDAEHVSAIISAFAVMGGVIAGPGLVWFKEWWLKREKIDQERTYLAIIVASHLNRFATGCLDVALDDGTTEGRPSGITGAHEATTVPPTFRPLELDVSWKVLPKDLLYSILRIPDQLDQVEREISGIWQFELDPPEHIAYFQARRREYAVLGLQASDAAKKLLSQSGLKTDEPDEDEWSRDKNLKSVISDIDAKRKAFFSQKLSIPQL